MRPETFAAFRLAMAHEELALYPTLFGRRGSRRRRTEQQRQKHLSKAQKLYERAKRLEERGLR